MIAVPSEEASGRTSIKRWLRPEGERGGTAFQLEWGGSTVIALVYVQTGVRSAAACRGTAANDLSFVSGNCAAGAFILTPLVSSTSEAELKSCQQMNLRRLSAIRDCEMKREAVQRTARTPYRHGRSDASSLAEQAGDSMPKTSGGSNERGDFAAAFDLPRDPRRDSPQFTWLSDVLRSQKSALADLFDGSGLQVASEAEDTTCDRQTGKVRYCRAIYRQLFIEAAAEKLARQ